MVNIMTFQDAVADAVRHASDRPTVLLGNGFSIDYDHRVFNYDSLAEKAELNGLSVDKADLFRSLKSSNFEAIMDKLRAAAALQKLYAPGSLLADVMKNDLKVVRRGLADSLANLHPDSAMALTDDEVEHAGTFLGNFDAIYTVNYDLLLYWVVNRTTVASVPKQDGFEWPTWRRSDRLIWKSNPSTGEQQVHYLHGALHLFVDDDGKLTKLSGSEHGRLIDELRRRLQDGSRPRVVTEGRREEKETRIDRSPYLRTMMRRFADVTGAVFIHGMSLSENDDHILELIEATESSMSALYVAIHGDPSTRAAQRIIRRARRIKDQRKENGGITLRLRFYDPETAHVWR
ncbi:hypothetical protein NS183_02890 [Microbacterium testaceum]|uniref:DUF4917 family protein n=1 Tax=Microbacterium testaceum TaxID=2033 RepID=UPI0007345CEE|nr:DUF4917 family protein [Microbacterium testaceum]KTS91721.1 hypothetical protein NS183_02890 [Microbacterium testaceum]